MNQDLLANLSPISSCPRIPLVLDFLPCALAFFAPLRSFPFVRVIKERSTKLESPLPERPSGTFVCPFLGLTIYAYCANKYA